MVSGLLGSSNGDSGSRCPRRRSRRRPHSPDIKPANILVAGPDEWKVGDFGIAKGVDHRSRPDCDRPCHRHTGPTLHPNDSPADKPHRVVTFTLSVLSYTKRSSATG